MKHRVVLGVSGSIAAYKACDIVRRLQEQNCDVAVVMSEGAKEFVTALTFEALSGRAVVESLFDGKNEASMAHIALAKWADIFVIAPATANIIEKMANGLADDALSCLALTTRAPLCIAPAMNTDMYNNPVVQKNMETLKNFGINFIAPKTATLACGDTGVGALADIDIIVQTVVARLKDIKK